MKNALGHSAHELAIKLPHKMPNVQANQQIRLTIKELFRLHDTGSTAIAIDIKNFWRSNTSRRIPLYEPICHRGQAKSLACCHDAHPNFSNPFLTPFDGEIVGLYFILDLVEALDIGK